MLTLHRVEIENFVCFDSIAIEFAAGSEKPLTVVRAENGSGKTTLLRAVRWGMYGEKSLPGKSARFSLHPAWWHPDEPDVRTRVSMEFETDGSSRNFEAADGTPSLYRLDRSVTTIGKPDAGENEPDFRRIGEATSLMVRDPGGHWGRHEMSPDAVVAELLPWELREFFIMDADEAADFVGGGENKSVSRKEYRAKTTHAINSLLGLEVFKNARDRVEDIARGFARKATRAIGDQDLNEQQEQLERCRDERQEVDREIDRCMSEKGDLEDTLEQLDQDIEEEVGRRSAYDSWSERLSKNREEHRRAVGERSACVAELAGDLESPELLASLGSAVVSETRSVLEPLHKRGQVPLAHVPFIHDLLLEGRCVCGQDLSEGSEDWRRVAELVAASEDEAAQADHLYYVYQAALSLRAIAEASMWNGKRTRHAASLAECDGKISALETEKRGLDAKLGGIDDEKIQVARDSRAACLQSLAMLTRKLALNESSRQRLDKEINPLAKKIAQRQRNQQAAADHQAAEDTARLAIGILDSAYAAIERQQVRSLSEQMNRLFHRMAANVSEEDFDAAQHSKADLRMINEVGVRPVEDRPGSFEIYALNSRGRAMPPVEINGASLRVLALSFVLALCDESDTRAPLLADSLLNFLSGTVRSNTLRVTARHSRQPILLLTSSDLEASAELEAVEKHAGATYTLTAQWDAIAHGRGGDVVHQTKQKLVSLLCRCGPRQYCNVCERTGQAEAAGWTKRRTERRQR